MFTLFSVSLLSVEPHIHIHFGERGPDSGRRKDDAYKDCSQPLLLESVSAPETRISPGPNQEQLGRGSGHTTEIVSPSEVRGVVWSSVKGWSTLLDSGAAGLTTAALASRATVNGKVVVSESKDEKAQTLLAMLNNRQEVAIQTRPGMELYLEPMGNWGFQFFGGLRWSNPNCFGRARFQGDGSIVVLSGKLRKAAYRPVDGNTCDDW